MANPPSIPRHIPGTESDRTLHRPHDHSLMEKEDVGGIVTDRCNACGRLWLDGGELDRLIAADEAVIKGANSGPFGRESGRAALGGRCCPRDGKQLLEIKHPHRPDVFVEVCPGCKGVLLDAGELRQISGKTAAEAASWLKRMQMMVRW
ncbi:MAG: zf-TFIIB domain-containing protein [Phycisphaerales bacterium]|nr:zf-TFIIB domain-containing protein [Phycisphaerales bacterium]